MERMEEWLDTVAENPLPGGVAVAALGAAMGAALVAKAAGLTIEREGARGTASAALRELSDLARSRGRDLLNLSRADAQAFQAVLDSRAQGERPAESWRARQEAIELPVRIAEGCQVLSRRASELAERCWPPARADLQSGIWLLEVGVRSAVLAAQANIRAWGEELVPESLRLRIAALGGFESD